MTLTLFNDYTDYTILCIVFVGSFGGEVFTHTEDAVIQMVEY